MHAAEFKNKIAEVYRIAEEVGLAYGIDKCTPDGHLVGAFGQIAAKIAFGLKFGASSEEHNCTWSDGHKKLDIQVRCTGAGSIALRREPIHLIAVGVSKDGSFSLLYNGPGKPVWQKVQHQKASQKYISRKALLELYEMVHVPDRLPIAEFSILD